ncbi:MAG: hypothetical protein H6Q90_4586 [Deltaproteobacteria bacterium]|nr:hypothetical protein [Deltaproteobacteria bacterium]
MKPLLLSSLLAGALALGTTASADPVVATANQLAGTHDLRSLERAETSAFAALQAAGAQVAATRARWDAAVAGGHPVPAGVWARRHAGAMQLRKAALARWQAAAARVDERRFAAR